MNLTSRLSSLGIDTVRHFRDLTNAFACTNSSARYHTMNKIFSPAEAFEGFDGYRALFEQRIISPVVRIPCWDGEVDVVPQSGYLVGSAEGAILFQDSFCEVMDEWSESICSITDTPAITLLHPN